MADMGKVKLESGWLAARSTEVQLTGTQLTTTHPPTGPTLPWMHAVIPGTVLATLVKNKVVPDPFYGLNNETIIDIADSGREHYTFWFFKSFQCKLSGTQHLDLNFRAINYSAEVFLNGHINVLPKGMFRRHSLDVTDILHPDGQNFLAVLVHPPDHPGSIPPEGGQGGDHEIGKDVAAQYVEGWDWVAPIRDRNTGIWDEVSISVTGPVKIIDPHLVSSHFDNYKRAYLHATTELENKGSWVAECSLNIQVTKEVEGSICLVEHLQTQHVSVPPGAHVQYTFPELFFYKPNLWWPNGMGQQSLYNVMITVDVKGYGESDLWSHLFGFRKIESHVDKATRGRLFKVNGQPMFIRGGNWILSDGLLRLSGNRYKTDIKFHADMNFNMIRCWGGGLAERPEFYHYCDIYGLLVWQEFWITGDVDGRGVPLSNPNGPLDHDLFMLCARDTVKLLRNHPSLALWVGGNEQVPPDDINKALKNDLKLHPYFENAIGITKLLEDSPHTNEKDPSQYLDGTRIYIQGSMWDGFANGMGDFTDGPYEIQNPESFFMDDFYNYGFNPEVGSVGMPVAATIRATMPPAGWEIPLFKKLPSGYIEEVPNPIWDYHKYIPYSKPGKVHDQIELYGIPKDLDEFCLKAQLVNYVQYRALLEGWTSRMWSKYTGVLIWKTQNPWTGLRGQFYDHLLDQTAGFYGCRSAAEPIHVQLNLATCFIEVVNTMPENLSDVAVEASVWDLDGTCPYYKVYEKLSVPQKRVVPIVEMKYPKSKNPKPVYFLLLKLYHMSDYGIISRNFYWLHPSGGDYKLLEPYRKKKIPLKITSKVFIKGSSYEIEMLVHNTSKKPHSKVLTYKNNFTPKHAQDDFDMALIEAVHGRTEEKQETSLFQRFYRCFSREIDGLRVAEVNGIDVGVAFFLHFSVHASKSAHNEGEDTRILPVHYSDNYFSLVPGEIMPIKISFEVPPGATPRVTLQGWNYGGGHTII
ncbi:Glyco_hydro_2 domain-containing protein/Glyco_hydro_2_C domain-containing protein/Glyco_hydro_2_N domain-containing protein [Cephalotus follicularis]|uniref:Glyco_hydro_2 domain-containing protein/Glyco_hydro_2_C domain-containing protein/Glyco_hydro_2_N domain-containing protein n=1 Tax=Cephalotus follicularis TaxID=3775 RepID=A0A1Q3B559_CEPFO|nr:Glyco_hydro_2 domain-containing protein/Glyco_hydro_2_C domain-containing protein/Glyco_hydro_2_N domain-containing protein [Cephalotus follicularis]